MRRNETLQARKERAIARGLGTMLPIYVEKAENAELWDVEGRRYIDFGAGIAVVNTGHVHPRVKAEVSKQMEAFSHTCLMITPYEQAVALAERLNALVPIGNAKTAFSTTGVEAVENTIKIARSYTGRAGVISFVGGFHGRTLLGMGLTGKAHPYKTGFGPFPQEVHQVPFPVAYHGVSVEDSLAAIRQLFNDGVDPSSIAAMIVEPVQGEGGFYPAPAGFLKALRQICDEHGIVFVVDEIQTGFGRTGTLFSVEQDDVEPDLMALAKGLAGGLPLSAVVGRAEIMDAPHAGGLGGTYAASPVACAAALAVLDVIETEDLLERAVIIGEIMRARLTHIQQRHPERMGDIRGRGAMVAVEWVVDGNPDQSDSDLPMRLIRRAAALGLIILPCGIRGNAIRLLAPLTISNALLDEGLAILEEVIDELV